MIGASYLFQLVHDIGRKLKTFFIGSMKLALQDLLHHPVIACVKHTG
jgi:hypothetical protein